MPSNPLTGTLPTVNFNLLLCLCIACAMSLTPPTLYEHYTSDGISEGLSAETSNFTLNKKPITIYGGALHYFRVHPAYWRDRLRKMRAAGLNTVETYVPWNLHEPEIGRYDFGKGGRDLSEFLDVETFVRTAREEDLLVIIRPGPYICAEWDFGGLPSWLLRIDDVKMRTSDPKFVGPVKRYLKELLGVLAKLQFQRGGPIVAFQIENEYGNVKVDSEPVDVNYLSLLKYNLVKKGVVELLFTSDTPSNGFWGTLPDVLATANFQEEAVKELTLLKNHQPARPLMVMEYWTGWFDHWSEKHHTRSAEAFARVLDDILAFNSSVNMYMFHGGTNWGLLNGGNVKGFDTTDNSAYQSDTTSYDYDAPLSENGDYSDKYFKVKELIAKYNTVITRVPERPPLIPRVAYATVKMEEKLSLSELVGQSESLRSAEVVPMELLDINNQSGQSYGYIVYRQENIDVAPDSILKIQGHVCDTVVVLINGQLVSRITQSQDDLNQFGYWRTKDSTLHLGEKSHPNVTLDLVVENFGRSNYGKLRQFNQFKGLWQGQVLINDSVLSDWTIVPLEFKKNWTGSLNSWKRVDSGDPNTGPGLYKGVLTVVGTPRDTYMDMREWTKGIVIVNGFVLGRYFKLGPQQCLYLPAPLLVEGDNQILVFEHFRFVNEVKFVFDPIFETLP